MEQNPWLCHAAIIVRREEVVLTPDFITELTLAPPEQLSLVCFASEVALKAVSKQLKNRGDLKRESKMTCWKFPRF